MESGPKIEPLEAQRPPGSSILKTLKTLILVLGGSMMAVTGAGLVHRELALQKESELRDLNQKKAAAIGKPSNSPANNAVNRRIFKCLDAAGECRQRGREAAAIAEPGLESAFSQLYLHPHTAVQCQETASACLYVVEKNYSNPGGSGASKH